MITQFFQPKSAEKPSKPLTFEERVESFHKTIFDYYDKHKRDLPWRKTTDRYQIMVSEVFLCFLNVFFTKVMLQQTQVSRVITKFNAWIKEFPTIKDLANAPLEKVLLLGLLIKRFLSFGVG